MSGGYLVLDLETVLDTAMPRWEPRDGGHGLAPPAFWKIVCVGVCHLDEFRRPQWIKTLDGETEDELLQEFGRTVNGIRKESGSLPTLTGFNIRGFDIPVLVAAAMRSGRRAALLFNREVVYRYSVEGSYDVSDLLTGFGGGRRASLDAWSRVIGFPGKLGTSGDDVAGLVAAGKMVEVRSYCLADVASTVALLLRTELVRGEIDDQRYDGAALELLQLMDRTPGLQDLRSEVDESRFVPRLERPKAWVDTKELMRLRQPRPVKACGY